MSKPKSYALALLSLAACGVECSPPPGCRDVPTGESACSCVCVGGVGVGTPIPLTQRVCDAPAESTR